MRPHFVLILISALSSLCGCTQGKYPDDWSSPTASIWSVLKNEGCPDLKGTWDVKERQISKRSISNGPWPIFGLIAGNKRNSFETLTITGDSRSELTLEYRVSFSSVLAKISEDRKKQIDKKYNDDFAEARFLNRMKADVRMAPPYNTMSDAEYLADLTSAFPFYMNRTLSVNAKRGREYKCNSGWLVELYSNDPKNTAGSTFSVGLNKDGDLLRKGERVDPQSFSIGWGDYSRDLFPLPDLHKEWWDRRVATTQIIEPAPPWQVPFTPATKSVLPKPEIFIPLTLEQVSEIVKHHLPKGVAVRKTRDSGNKWEITISAARVEDVSQFVFSLNQDPKLSQVELSDQPSSSNGNTAKVWIRPAGKR